VNIRIRNARLDNNVRIRKVAITTKQTQIDKQTTQSQLVRPWSVTFKFLDPITVVVTIVPIIALIIRFLAHTCAAMPMLVVLRAMIILLTSRYLGTARTAGTT
jgi:hypothetical protein